MSRMGVGAREGRDGGRGEVIESSVRATETGILEGAAVSTPSTVGDASFWNLRVEAGGFRSTMETATAPVDPAPNPADVSVL